MFVGALTTGSVAAEDGTDCNTLRDSPPAIRMYPELSPFWQASCEGNMDFDTTWDEYYFWATTDDWIEIDFAWEECELMWSFSKDRQTWTTPTQADWRGLSTYTGWWWISVEIDWWNPCTSQYAWNNWPPRNYRLDVTVIPNNRPALSVTGPDTVIPGDTYSWTLNANDGDSNLSRVGADFGYGTNWKSVSGRTSSTTWTSKFEWPGQIKFTGRDSYGAEEYLHHYVTLKENDCGTGDDIDTLYVAFPYSCARAHTWPNISDYSDTFEFDVPSDTSRIYVTASPVSGWPSTTLSLVDPSGTTVVNRVPGPVFAAASPGRWKLNVFGGNGSYSLLIKPTGPQAPPVFTLTSSKPSVHQGNPITFTMNGTDPNGQRITYSLDWGDGTANGIYTVESGKVHSVSHRYTTSTTSATITARATNEEGLSSLQSITIGITPHNDCVFGAGYDAPDARTGSPLLEPAPSCSGELGYFHPNGVGLDYSDVYVINLDKDQPLRVDLSTMYISSPKLAMEWIVGGVQIPAQSGSSNGNKQFIDLPLALKGRYYIFVTGSGGQGTYTVTIKK